MEIPVFNDSEYEFLQNYQKILSLVAIALKTLEANKFTFGLYLPTLFGLRIKLNELANDLSTNICYTLVTTLQDSFEVRLGSFMNPYDHDDTGQSTPLYLAMVSNPIYKMNYMGFSRIPSHILKRIQTILFNAGIDVLRAKENESQSEPLVSTTTTSTVENQSNFSQLIKSIACHI